MNRERPSKHEGKHECAQNPSDQGELEPILLVLRFPELDDRHGPAPRLGIRDDQAMRLAMLVCAAREALRESDVDEIAWLSRGKAVLAGRSPFEAAQTSIGFDQAINLTQALAWEILP